MKKILAFICVLTLVMSLCSMFSFATAPEAEEGVQTEMSTRDLQTGKTNKTTYIYNSYSTSSGYKYSDPIPKNETVYIYSLVTSNGVQFYKINWQNGTAHIGYVLKNNITLT